MIPVGYLPEARDDIAEAYSWYEAKQSALGDRFLERLKEAIARIQEYPTLPAVIDFDVRAVPLKKFPYVVYYQVADDQILIVAITHGRRSARVWRKRL